MDFHNVTLLSFFKFVSGSLDCGESWIVPYVHFVLSQMHFQYNASLEIYDRSAECYFIFEMSNQVTI